MTVNDRKPYRFPSIASRLSYHLNINYELITGTCKEMVRRVDVISPPPSLNMKIQGCAEARHILMDFSRSQCSQTCLKKTMYGPTLFLA